MLYFTVRMAVKSVVKQSQRPITRPLRSSILPIRHFSAPLRPSNLYCRIEHLYRVVLENSPKETFLHQDLDPMHLINLELLYKDGRVFAKYGTEILQFIINQDFNSARDIYDRRMVANYRVDVYLLSLLACYFSREGLVQEWQQTVSLLRSTGTKPLNGAFYGRALKRFCCVCPKLEQSDIESVLREADNDKVQLDQTGLVYLLSWHARYNEPKEFWMQFSRFLGEDVPIEPVMHGMVLDVFLEQGNLQEALTWHLHVYKRVSGPITTEVINRMLKSLVKCPSQLESARMFYHSTKNTDKITLDEISFATVIIN